MDARFEGVVSGGKVPDIADRRCGHTHNRRSEDRVFVEVGKHPIQHAGRRDPSAGAKLDPANLCTRRVVWRKNIPRRRSVFGGLLRGFLRSGTASEWLV